ncbi:MAG: FAD-dependent 5-carboxymethylaminomethyl-2-thiouridine(34) oxidoreductase MnmC [Snodgrassella sp.]|uniref:FAD-dependent 5-carboxymethylaminomethyl-2-thiouridine(34) oxidoreductase MnmC n=1 Tax=Snodgrassella sp. TaxID=2815304 RepID=UPI00258486F3|nr:FAD-dependent 5-carboxymethylaminomethyl-2-thiouridine(34) oxidoreductase MnmC [Snodgrassella sp.]MCO6513506.1 FAD-dependent 5-carboxymethylaminomethyl-2-thiouridine(34) oxidoreductase MnmC [Snodgrassella sp.]
MSIYIFHEWPQPDELAQQLGNDKQAEIVVVTEKWPESLTARSSAGQNIAQLWLEAKVFWQQQPVFSYPFGDAGKFTFIQPQVYEQWCQFNPNMVSTTPEYSKFIYKPWLTLPTPIPVKSVVIIGAGIAGASTAFALAKRGIAVTVIEQHSIASAASGNHLGLLYAKISAHSTIQTELLLASYGYSRALLKNCLPAGKGWLDCGVIHLDYNTAEKQRNTLLAQQNPHNTLFQTVTKAEAERIAGIDVPYGGLWWPYGAAINPFSLTEALLRHPLISVLTATKANTISRQNDLWQIGCQNQQKSFYLDASHIVICAGAESNSLYPVAGWPLHKIRGQTTTASLRSGATQIKCALSGNSYITPPWQHKLCFGATFHPNQTNDNLSVADEHFNWEQLRQWLPHLAANLNPNTSPQGHAAIRCDAFDHLPVVGPVGDTAAMLVQYAQLRLDKNYPVTQPCPWQPGVFVNTAHGSRGLVTAPLCAEAIAATMLGLPSPLSVRLQQALHPNRLPIRSLTHHQSFQLST